MRGPAEDAELRGRVCAGVVGLDGGGGLTVEPPIDVRPTPLAGPTIGPGLRLTTEPVPGVLDVRCSIGVVASGDGLALRLRGFSASTSRSRMTSLMFGGKAGDIGCVSVKRRMMLTSD
jgi:hypothetical protein